MHISFGLDRLLGPRAVLRNANKSHVSFIYRLIQIPAIMEVPSELLIWVMLSPVYEDSAKLYEVLLSLKSKY